MKKILMLSFVLLCVAGPALAQAQKENAPNPVQTLSAQTDELLKTLDENQTRQFQAIRAAHGTIRGVEDVRTLLTRAVEGCARKNPDMTARLNARFTSWTDAVNPVIRQGKNRLDKMVLLQNYAAPSEVRRYLGLFDKAVDWRTAQAQTVPVTEREACEKMTKSMDETQAELTTLLVKTLKLDQDLIIQPKKK